MRESLKKLSKKSETKVKKVNWLGINHDVIHKVLEGNPKFLNYINVGTDGDLVAAVYHVAKPNIDKGHKEYVLLWNHPQFNRLMISGMTKKEINKHAKVSGVLCSGCNTTLFSLNRHDYHTCECDNHTMVDGGKDYLRYGGVDMSFVIPVTINLLTDKIIDKKSKLR